MIDTIIKKNSIEDRNLLRILQFEKVKYNKDSDINKLIKNISNNDYLKLESFYINKIPLWETIYKNLKKYPDLYNDEKWIIGKRENKRIHNKLLILDNGFKLKIGYLWKKQPFKQRPTFNKKFIKNFKTYYNGKLIIEDENWGSILSKSKQYIKDNSRKFYDNYDKILIKGYCKSENIEFDIVEFDILENKWFL